MQLSFLRIFLCGLLFSLPVFAEHIAPITDPVIPNIPKLTQSSGYIFAGTVKSVERVMPRNQRGTAVMRITFQVQRGMLGITDGQMLTVNEWAGLWQTGERYRAGEQVLLFLYPPSKLGLTSPVGGWSGHFNIDGGKVIGRPVAGPSRFATPTSDAFPRTPITIDDVAREVQRAREE
jgi:hypothetical protein